VSSFVRGDLVDEVFVVRKLEVQRGTPEVSLELQDRTGSIGARWTLDAPGALGVDSPERTLQLLRASPYVRARGAVIGAARKAHPSDSEGEKGSSVELRLDELSPVHPSQVRDVRELYEHTPEDQDKLFAELRSTYLEHCRNGFVRRLLISFLDDHELVEKLRYAPAASSYHHSYVGGLLEHIASLTRLALNVVKTYPRLDVDLMLAGVFLHDLGKVDELGWERGLRYTDRGQLMGHIAIGVLLLEDKVRAIEGFPVRLRDVLHHLILSHHGTREFGSPVLPATPEALAVHHLDNLDGKLWSAWRAQDEPGGDAEWSPYNRHLSRRIYRGDLDPGAP
jgi:3'-5' exoribonuclease